MEYRILIVDDNQATRHRAAQALVASPPAPDTGYKITATGSPAAAEIQLMRHSYHALIATARPGNEAIGLAERWRKQLPNTPIVLIAEGSLPQAAIEVADRIGARLLASDEIASRLVDLVADLIGARPATASSPPGAGDRPPATLADLKLLLDVMRRQARAQAAFYIDSLGNIVAQVGDLSGLDTAALGSLIAGSFVNAIEMARVMRDDQTTHLSVHEGHIYDVYATNVGAQRMIVLVFDKQVVQPKLGMVWLLMKRAAEQLGRMHVVEQSIDHMLGERLSASLNQEFDRLFGGELESAA